MGVHLSLPLLLILIEYRDLLLVDMLLLEKPLQFYRVWGPYYSMALEGGVGGVSSDLLLLSLIVGRAIVGAFVDGAVFIIYVIMAD